jgi:chromosome segregation ATPase
LDIANKRAVDSEKRLEDMLGLEKTTKVEYTNSQLALKLKLDKKKAQLHEVVEQKNDLEIVAKELYDELQNALIVTRRLQQENDTYRDELDRMKAMDGDSGILREKLEIEYERCKQLEDMCDNAEKEINNTKRAFAEVTSYNEKAELTIIELKEDMAGLQYEHEKLKNRCNLLTKDNLNLEETIKSLRNNIIVLNDKIIEVKGSIRVFCRVRPLFNDEVKKLEMSVQDLESFVRYPDYNLLEFNSVPFEFDRVFDINSDQKDIFDEVDPYIRSVMGGCRVCIFA